MWRSQAGRRSGSARRPGVVLTNREHIIALEPLDESLIGTLLRYLTKYAPRTSISTRSRKSN